MSAKTRYLRSAVREMERRSWAIGNRSAHLDRNMWEVALLPYIERALASGCRAIDVPRTIVRLALQEEPYLLGGEKRRP